MASTTSIFFAGVGTSLLLIGAGFGSGLLLGQAAVDVPQKSRTVGSQSNVPPPAKVILPAMTTASPSASQTVEAAAPMRPAQAEPEPTAEPTPVKDVQEQAGEREKQARQHVEREKQQAARKVAAHERRKRYALQKAARRHQQGQQQQQLTAQQQEMPRQSEQPRVLAFGRSEGPNQQIGFFGN